MITYQIIRIRDNSNNLRLKNSQADHDFTKFRFINGTNLEGQLTNRDENQESMKTQDYRFDIFGTPCMYFWTEKVTYRQDGLSQIVLILVEVILLKHKKEKNISIFQI